MPSICSWNVNSVKARFEHLEKFINSKDAPDILLLQELKCVEENFPLQMVEEAGYNVIISGQKTYNGVAILSKFPIEESFSKLDYDDIDQEQARYLEAVISIDNEVIRVINLYVPNGQSEESDKFIYKMKFLNVIKNHIANLLKYNEKLFIGADYNIAPFAKDIYSPESLDGTICFHEKERAIWRELTGLGLYDAFRLIHPDTHQFSWWDYRGGAYNHNKGFRIDHFLVSSEAADIISECKVLNEYRELEKPSDHAPVLLDFAIKS